MEPKEIAKFNLFTDLQNLIQLAKTLNFTLNINTESLTPLAMGNAKMVPVVTELYDRYKKYVSIDEIESIFNQLLKQFTNVNIEYNEWDELHYLVHVRPEGEVEGITIGIATIVDCKELHSRLMIMQDSVGPIH